MSFQKNATVVVVHGAWADGSSWQAVIRPLQERGLNVIAAPIPLTSLSDDAAALKRTIARTHGPVIVAGHAFHFHQLLRPHVFENTIYNWDGEPQGAAETGKAGIALDQQTADHEVQHERFGNAEILEGLRWWGIKG